MAFIAPQLIPKKKENGGQGVANWRSSPGLKPNTSPKPLPIDSLPPTLTLDAQYEDYIVNIRVPGPCSRDKMEKILLPEVGYATTHAYGYLMHIGKPATIPLDREGVESNPDSKNESLSGPALHFKTPKAELVTTGGALSSPFGYTPEAPPAAVNKHGLPAMELPPAAGTPPPEGSDELFVAVYGTQDAADNAKHLLKTALPKATVTIATRKRGSTNATLVLKGVPFQTRIDSLIEHLTNHLTYKPSYVRLHRSERGVFKCVVFLKFSTRVIAEHSKLELERITVGTRPLRIEFKKQQREPIEPPAAAAAAAAATPAPASTNVSAPASLGNLPPPPAYGSQRSPQALLGMPPPPAYNASPAAAPLPPAPYAAMESTIASVALGDYGGCVYTTADLKPEDIRYLAHLCAVTGLQLTAATPSNVPAEANISLLPTATPTSSTNTQPDFLLVRKRPTANATPAAAAAGAGGIMDRSSPQVTATATPKFTPRVGPATPSWAAHTPSSLQPMDFRGIRHWKEMRQEATSQAAGNTGATLGVIRPAGPGSLPAFGSGRGRPPR